MPIRQQIDDDTRRRVLNLLARGVLSRTDDVSAENGFQMSEVTLLRDEAKATVERFQQYGFSSNPPLGSECIVLFVGGGRDHGIVLSIDNRVSRLPGQAEGEVALYTDEGDYIVLKRDNTIEIASEHLVIEAGIDIHVDANEEIRIAAGTELSADAPEIKLHAEHEITLAAPRITLRSPQIRVEGDITFSTGSGRTMHLNGNLIVDGNINSNSTITAQTIYAPQGSVGFGRTGPDDGE